ncbi:MAG: lactonase family protein [Nitrososphaerales archaeon]
MAWDEDQALTFYIGTYTNQPSPQGRTGEGIYRATLLPASGALRVEGVAAQMTNPTFLALRGDRIYAIGEVGEHDGEPGGVVAAFAVDPATGDLSLINQQSSGGAGPAYVTTDATARTALVANYVGGSVASLPIGAEGALEPPSQVVAPPMPHEGPGPVTDRQDAPHAHSIIPDRNNRFAFAADLGADRIYQYTLDPVARRIGSEPVHAYDVFPGTGPRHLTFHPSGRWLYVIGELSSTLIVYSYEANNGLLREPIALPMLPPGWDGQNTASEVAVSPDGRFIYAGNRGYDSITAFRVSDDSGTVTLAGQYPTAGSFPRHFALDPSGEWLVVANQNSDNLTTFRVDQESGALEWTGQSLQVPVPVCVVFR